MTIMKTFVSIAVYMFFILAYIDCYAQNEKQEINDFPVLRGPYFGQKPPGIIPEIFASDFLVKEKQAHSNIVFSKEGREAYWCHNGIWFSKVMDGKWTTPEMVPFSRKEYSDDAPFLSPDGKHLFFASKRSVTNSDKSRKENIWMVDIKKNGWSDPKVLPPNVNKMFQHWQVSVDIKGNLYFKHRPNNDPNQDSDIYYSQFINGEYQKPEKLGLEVNSEANEGNPFISPNGDYIIFSRIKNRKLIDGGLFISYRLSDDTWSNAKSLQQYLDFNFGGNCPIVSQDGKYLFFLDIHEGKWQRFWVSAKILVIPINSCNQSIKINNIENGLLKAVVIEGSSFQGMNIYERIKHYKVPGLSIAVINDFKLEWVKAYGVLDNVSIEPINTYTLFQAASISKPVAAMTALKLVEDGKVDLKENINNKLTSWKVPENEFTQNKKVTLQGILNHSAGITVHGFGGYALDEDIPTLLQILNGEKPANSDPILTDICPDSIARYSGGGYTIMQQLLIDIEKKSFHDIVNNIVLNPLGMMNSTYVQPLPNEYRDNTAKGHHTDGLMIKGNWHTYPELAAAGLWTTPTDLENLPLK